MVEIAVTMMATSAARIPLFAPLQPADAPSTSMMMAKTHEDSRTGWREVITGFPSI